MFQVFSYPVATLKAYWLEGGERCKFDATLIREAALLFVLAVFTNLYYFTHFSFSIDDEIAAMRTDHTAWLAQGRFTVWAVEKFVFSQPAIPYAPFVFFTACAVLAYMLLARAHGVAPGWKSYLAFPVFCAYPTWWLIFEFYANVPATGLGLLLVCGAAYLTVKPGALGAGGGWRSNLGIVAMLAVAIGAYQSFVLMYAGILCGAALAGVLREPERRPDAAYCWRVVLLTATSLLLYALANALGNRLGAPSDGYVSGFIDVSAWRAPLNKLAFVLREAGRLYFGSAQRFGASWPAAAALFGWAVLLVLGRAHGRRGLAALLFLGVLISPFLLHFLSGSIPLRAMVALPYVAWFMAAMSLVYVKGRLTAVLVALLLVYQFQAMSITSQYWATAEISQANDRLLAADIYRRIGATDANFDRNAPLLLDVYGGKDNSGVYVSAWSSATAGSFFGWDGGNLLRIVTYLRVQGHPNVRMASREQRAATIEIFRQMPIWPADGSVRKVGDAYLVRLGQAADPVHARLSGGN